MAGLATNGSVMGTSQRLHSFENRAILQERVPLRIIEREVRMRGTLLTYLVGGTGIEPVAPGL